jgi:chitinase
VIVSFGGAAGQELAQACSDASSLQAQYQAIINRYNVTHLDFDVEGGEQGDQTTYDRRNTALAALQQANPGLTISFTLPSATTGLESDSIGLLNNAVSHGVTFNIVNLMVMDYGGPDSQMGQEAINAANGLHGQLQQIFLNKSSSQLWSMVGLTPMIGKNDSSGEVFSLSNASQVLSFAQSNKIGELSFWAVSRDNGGCPGETGNGSSDTCSGISQSNYAFLDTFEPFTSGSSGGGATYYKIVNQNSGLALDVTNQSTSNGAVVQQWDYVGGANQQWQLISVGGGYDEIVNRNSGLALDVTNQSTSNGAVIQQWAYTGNGGANQKWQVVDVGSGYDKIVNQNSSKVLDVTNHSTSNGAVIQQWDYVGGSNQQWSLQQV